MAKYRSLRYARYLWVYRRGCEPVEVSADTYNSLRTLYSIGVPLTACSSGYGCLSCSDDRTPKSTVDKDTSAATLRKHDYMG